MNSTTHYKFMEATGKLQYNMTNDYMFRTVIQRDKETLIGIICSVLQIPRELILNVKIENPIVPGESIEDKEYQLDILVSLNDNTFINLEMQVVNYNNWPMRSLAYLCRKYDNLHKGVDYLEIKPVYHIGFIDFNLFENHPEFFAKYQIRNAKDNYLYTDKFNLFVIELNHINLATAEDKTYGLDAWAKLFKAKTWEEIKMITKDNPSMNSTAENIFKSNSDEQIRELCRRREDQIAHENYQKNLINKLSSENEQLSSENEQLSSENEQLSSKNEQLSSENERLKKLLEKNNILIN